MVKSTKKKVEKVEKIEKNEEIQIEEEKDLETVLDNIDKAETKEKSEKVNKEIKELNEKVENDLDEKVNEVEKKLEKLEDEIGKANGNRVFQKQGFIRTVNLISPIPMYKIPEDIRQYLLNMGFGTNVYKESKEWLIKHGADLEMIQKLKDYLSNHFN